MKKGWILALIVALVVALTALTTVLVLYFSNRAMEREVFVNNSFFLLKDSAEELLDEKKTQAVIDRLQQLDQLCRSQSRYTDGALNYTPPYVFSVIAAHLENGSYTKAERIALKQDLLALVQAMADKTGLAENKELSYEQLNTLFRELTEKWG